MNGPRPGNDLVLFALSGVGNAVLGALCRAGWRPRWVATRIEPNPFPHYPEEPLAVLAERLGVPCLPDREGERLVTEAPPRVLMTATYHRILKPDLLDRIEWAVNLHPSLLPRLRGPNPFHWCIRNGETETGVTAHLLTAGIDTGGILGGRTLAVAADETQGSLRERLAGIAGDLACGVMADIEAGRAVPVPQDEALATMFGRPAEDDRRLDPAWGVAEAARRVRSFSPFPGVPVGGNLAIGVEGLAAPSEVPPGTVLPAGPGRCKIRLSDGDLLLKTAVS